MRDYIFKINKYSYLFLIIANISAASYSLDCTINYKIIKTPIQFNIPINLYCDLDKNTILNCNIFIYNSNLTFSDAYLTIDVVKSDKRGYIYPSQYSKDNIFFEKNIKLNLLPNMINNLSFKYKLPSNISCGKYRIDVYMHTSYLSLRGIPFIFLNPVSYYFEVNKDCVKNGYPYIEILRDKTNLNNIVGPIGGLFKNQTPILNLYLNSSKNLDNVIVKIYVSRWNDIANKPIITKMYNISVKKGIHNYILKLPKFNLTPDAYSLRIEVYYKDQLQSIYRLRFIIPGPSLKIRGIFAEYPLLSPYVNNTIYILLGPSPDHYNYPILKKGIVHIKIGDKMYNLTFSNVSYPNFYKILLSCINYNLLNNFTICVETTNFNNKTLDHLCKTFYLNISDTFIKNIDKVYFEIKNNKSIIFIVPHSILNPNNISYEIILAKDDPSNIIFHKKVKGIFKYSINNSGIYYITISYKDTILSKKLIISKNKKEYNLDYFNSKEKNKIQENKEDKENTLKNYILIILIFIIFITIISIYLKAKAKNFNMRNKR